MNYLKYLWLAGVSLLVAVVLSLSGCGTINTVFYEDKSITSSLQKKKTNCDTLPRFYSGISYDLCVLHGPPEPNISNAPGAPEAYPWPIMDLIPSLVLDTLFLPYTIYRQSVDGSVDLTH
ncbi:YceK/YidQ family lipoprotein [Pseudomonas fluorescens]|uniref:Uncharacterized conserved protein YceK n=1 Tax=Pseudomonas fluorescens TaxID=294 RepID=A0ABY1TCR0_PSEFL|nr:YceK/YidQ family lipoprotein [Pseudomonas fluorescens]MCI4604623.1 YceK/YidQ family lipoprotein [Pseudomonas fluorescens]PQB00771.1 hypothetical protein B0A76_11030 [Pseudomonas fluorescens]RFP94445.1 YceK/YidQ family lipoprotein [Pseudomonas fluorescens]SNY10038.1 Uncharacterized conserved protein YceK [Pseudomonas fluorescens]